MGKSDPTPAGETQPLAKDEIYRYAELLKRSRDLLNNLLGLTGTVTHKFSQAQVDYNGLVLRIARKSTELAEIEKECQSRRTIFEASLATMRRELETKLAALDQKLREAESLRIHLAKENNLATTVRKDLETERRALAL